MEMIPVQLQSGLQVCGIVQSITTENTSDLQGLMTQIPSALKQDEAVIRCGGTTNSENPQI